jgi:hypothetical protein
MQLLHSIFIGWIILLSRVNPHYSTSLSESSEPALHLQLWLNASFYRRQGIKLLGSRFGFRNRRAPMKPATIIGIVLILLGIVGFVTGGVSFTHEKKDVDVGPVQIEHKETRTLPISPILSTISLLAGVGLVVVGSKS